MTAGTFVRWEAVEPNERGTRPGVFALANGLARSGRLDPDEFAWWRATNDRLDTAYQDPGLVDPNLFDRSLHPGVACWFRTGATRLLGELPAYLALLDRHGVGWVERRSDDPGRVLYSDDVQVVVVPHGEVDDNID